MLAFNFAANLILIPRLSIAGAAWAKLMTEALHLALMALLTVRYLAPLPVHRIMFKPALSCAFMSVFILLFPGWSLVSIVPAGALAYVAFLAVVRGYTRAEIAFLKRTSRRLLFRKRAAA